MPLSEEYQYTHDIDLFCIISENYIHIASNGGLLPNNINNTILLERIQNHVAQMPSIFNYKLNKTYLDKILNDGRLRHVEMLDDNSVDLFVPMSVDFGNHQLSPKEKVYCWSFIEMAQKGFFSYDRDNDGYHLIAKPTELLDDSQHVNYPLNLPQLNSEEIKLIDFPEL